MTVLDARLSVMLAVPPEVLRLSSDAADSRTYNGRYLHIGEKPYALGREVGRGEDALVYELIDLRTGLYDHVVKICRHHTSTARYRRWATPITFQRNIGSTQPDLEMVPSHLLPLPYGGLVKIQPYMAAEPATDWMSHLPVQPLLRSLSDDNSSDIENGVDKLIESHGEQAILLEIKGRLRASRGEYDNAINLLSNALAKHMATGNSSRFSAAIAFGHIAESIYQRDRSTGTIEARVQVDDGTVLRNTIFASAIDAARDDTLQDRAVFALVEVMADLPYFVAGLNFLQESLIDLPGSPAFSLSSDAVHQIDPTNPLLVKIVEGNLWHPHGTNDDDVALATKAAPVTALPALVPDIPALREHEAAYNPEPQAFRAAAARASSGLIAWKEGRLANAEHNFQEAIAADPAEPEHRVRYASFLRAAARADQAVGCIRRAIIEIPGEPTLRLFLAILLIRAGHYTEAEDTIVRAQPLLPERAADIALLLTASREHRGNA